MKVLALLWCFALIASSSATRLKFQIREIHTPGARLARSADLCADLDEVPKQTLKAPVDGINPPWLNERVKVWKSDAADSAFDRILSAKVECLDPKHSFLEVFERFRQDGCWILPFGGAVRDIIRGQTIHDVDAECSCSPEKTRAVCQKHFGKQCWSNKGSHILHVGGSAKTSTKMDLANWDKTFFGDGTSLEFSTNCMAYDWTQKVIIDLSSGTGPQDTCDSLIRIPVPYHLWQTWLTSGKDKSMRFWKLRAKGYVAADEQTLELMTERFKQNMQKKKEKENIKYYYCKYALKGSMDGGVCYTEADCKTRIINGFDESFQEDFSRNYYDTEIKPALKKDITCEHKEQGECKKSAGTSSKAELLAVSLMLLSTLIFNV